MARFIFSYDLQGDHTAFKNLCLKHGFFACIRMSNGNKEKLPSTTLVAEFDDQVAALSAFKRLAELVDVHIEKVVIAERVGTLTLVSDELC